jgi:Transposase DDE domain
MTRAKPVSLPNKHATKTDLVRRNTYYKNKFGVKLSTIVDVNGIPLNLLLEAGSAYDSTLVEHLFTDDILVGLKSGHYVTSKKFKKLLLADSGYDSIKVKNFLKGISLMPVIAANKRNTP